MQARIPGSIHFYLDGAEGEAGELATLDVCVVIIP